MRTHPHDHEPLFLLASLVVTLWIPKGFPITIISSSDARFSSMRHENWTSSPLDSSRSPKGNLCDVSLCSPLCQNILSSAPGLHKTIKIHPPTCYSNRS